MNAALKPLSDRIEDGIRQRVEERIAAAMLRARHTARMAYADALRPECGRPFDVVVFDILREAEARLTEAARAEVERIETQNVLKRLAAA